MVKLRPFVGDLIQKDLAFNTRYYLLINIGKALRKSGLLLSDREEGLQCLQECYKLSTDLDDDKVVEDQVVALYEIAKAFYSMINFEEVSAVANQKNIENAFLYAQRCYQLNFKMRGDFNILCVKLLDLQFKCYKKMNDIDSAIRYLE
jgi:hypothetical protein